MSAEYSEELVSKVTETFEGKGPEVLTILKDVGGELRVAVRDEVAETLTRAGLRVNRAPRGRKFEAKTRHMKRIMDNNGFDPVTGQRWTMDDFLDVDKQAVRLASEGKLKLEEFRDTQMSGEQPMLTPRVVEMAVKEAIEPELNILPLFQTIRYSNGPILSFPAMSGMVASGTLEIVEGGEYPEAKMEMAGQVTTAIGKHGIKVSMSDECRRYSMWDLWAMNLRGAGRMLARHKEQLAVDRVLSLGTTYIDNTTPGARHTTGRSAAGGFNGTFTMWDLFDTCADLLQAGYQANVILMHPFAWPVFALDPVMRSMAFLAGQNPLPTGYQGRPGNGAPFDFGGLGQNRSASEPANLASTYSSVPSGFTFGSMRVIVSPFIPFDLTHRTTSIYVADSRDLGILVVDEELVSDEWRHPEHDITNVKFRERYSFASANLGRAIRIIKGVVVDRGYAFEGGVLQASVTLSNSETSVLQS